MIEGGDAGFTNLQQAKKMMRKMDQTFNALPYVPIQFIAGNNHPLLVMLGFRRIE